MIDITDNSKENIEAAKAPTEFYKYAYTELLRRYAVTSCDKVLSSGEALQRDIETLLKDMQELVYNCTPAELESMKDDLIEPTHYVQRCAEQLNEALVALRNYKVKMLTTSNL